MVTWRVAALLLRVAVRRWPAELRTDLAREWAAELHELARTGRRWGMVRFAASLAARRAATPLTGRTGSRRSGRTAGVLLLAPPACVAVLVLAGAVMALTHGWLEMRVPWAAAAQLPTWSALTALFGTALALGVTRAARRTVRVGALPTALGVVLPIAATATATLALLAARGESRAWETVPGLLLWLALLTAALWAAGALARRGRVRLAWSAGLLGALVAADAAVVLAVVTSIPATAPVADGLPPDAWTGSPRRSGCSPAGPTRRSGCPGRPGGNGSSSPTGCSSSRCSTWRARHTRWRTRSRRPARHPPPYPVRSPSRHPPDGQAQLSARRRAASRTDPGARRRGDHERRSCPVRTRAGTGRSDEGGHLRVFRRSPP
ncbi:hypothetical protein O7622_25795 [Micromonospora sp. WMMD1076]|uniref:hypothetical protein n=1 Tax=Micromonospora sp. WMMD1076 TaxID=3016103 RepID=UPI00249C7CAB|nr:hypothetical protein [Micromonospora sp. WMMD1076]WFF06425.1 hypothetical protein O7622_25795 [Micromonospora sp. WMMD1076]